MSTIKRFWNNIVRPSLNDALDRFDNGDDHRPEDDPEEQTPTRRRNAEANVGTLEQEVAEQRRRLEEAERRLQAARQAPPPAAPHRPDPAQATTRPASAQAERPRRATSGRDPFLEEAERELDEALKRYQNNVTQPNPAANAQARQRANFSDDDAARWVAEQQASRGAQGQQARRPQSGGQQAAPRANNQIPQHYAILRLPNGSSLQQVKDAYRKLMRDNHPDRFTNDPVRHRQATEVSQKLSRAYMELRRHLGDIR
jgi:hypothetical protein